MQLSKELQKRIEEYLDEVSSHMGDIPSGERPDTLQYLREHIEDSLGELDADAPTIADVEAVIAEMDTPDSYGNDSADKSKGIAGKITVAIVFIAVLATVGAVMYRNRTRAQIPPMSSEEKMSLSDEEITQIAKDAVMTISTCAEADPRVKKALESLKGLDESIVVQELASSLNSKRNTIRRSAIYILWNGNLNDIAPAKKDLIELCSHQEEHTRGMAALALGANKVEASFDVLSQMTTDDKSRYARRCGAYGLGLLGQVKAKPILEKALKDSDKNVRSNAEAALTMIEQCVSGKKDGKGVQSAAVDNPLQALIDAAEPNSVVNVSKGKYTKPVVIDKALTLKGVSRDECVIEVTDNYPAILVDASAETQVRIEGLTVKWQLATSDPVDFPHAIGAKDAAVHVENCSILPLGDHKRSPIAIMAMGFADLTILNSSFEGFDYTICYGEGTKGVVRNVSVIKSVSQGVILYRGASVDISESIFAGSGKHGVRSTGGTLTLHSNLIIGNANRGVYLGNKSASGKISDNILMHNATGISGFGGSTVEVVNNLIIDSSYAAIDMRGSCKLTIENNIIQGNPRGIALYSDKDENENTVKGNTFWKNKQDTENIELKNIVSTDPLFKNLQDGDFTLQDGPAKAAGHGPRNHQQLNELWMRYKNVDANPAEESKAESVESSSNPFKDCTEVKYDSGKSNGKQSYGGRYPAVKIDVSDIIAKAGGSDKVFLAGLKIYASRYGVDYKPEETFMRISVLSNEGTDHANSKYPFSLFSFSEKWVDLVLSEVISLNRYVDDNGMITIALDPEAGQYKGIYFHFTSHPDVCHALVGRIDSGFEEIDDRQWMIRAFFKTK